jgi:hypothetical protein
MKTRTKIAATIMAAGTLTTLAAGPATAAPGDELGGVNMAGFCQYARGSLGGGDGFAPRPFVDTWIIETPGTPAYDWWYCVTAIGERVKIDHNSACQYTYPGRNALSYRLDDNDAKSIRCREG